MAEVLATVDADLPAAVTEALRRVPRCPPGCLRGARRGVRRRRGRPRRPRTRRRQAAAPDVRVVGLARRRRARAADAPHPDVVLRTVRRPGADPGLRAGARRPHRRLRHRRGAPDDARPLDARHRERRLDGRRRNASAPPSRSCSATSRWPGPTTCCAGRASIPSVLARARPGVGGHAHRGARRPVPRRRQARHRTTRRPRPRCASAGTRPPPTPSSARCTWVRRSPEPTTTSCPPTAASAPTSGSPSSCATTCWACSATRRSPASPRATTCARASGRCSSPSPAVMPTAAAAALVERAVGKQDLDVDERRRGPRARSSRSAWSPTSSAASHPDRLGPRRPRRVDLSWPDAERITALAAGRDPAHSLTGR